MRARLALRLSQQTVVLREILLKDKPAEMLSISAKGTVPVLQLGSGLVIDESIDIAYWALQQNDPEGYLALDNEQRKQTQCLVASCDGDFKHWLDRYKYADRYPEHPAEYYRQQAETFLFELEKRLQKHKFLLSNRAALADIAIFPFIRQFALVDKAWFDQIPHEKLRAWLAYYLESELFNSIMVKVATWSAEQKPIYL